MARSQLDGICLFVNPSSEINPLVDSEYAETRTRGIFGPVAPADAEREHLVPELVVLLQLVLRERVHPRLLGPERLNLRDFRQNVGRSVCSSSH